MSTRCMIGILNKDGSINATYCHQDGNLANVGQILKKYYGESEVKKLFQYGQMSSLDEIPENSDFYDDDSDKVIHYNNIEEYTHEMADHEFHYYLDLDNGKWFVIVGHWNKIFNHFVGDKPFAY